MLTRMEAERISFDAVLADAQAKRGFAEADPTDDLDGYDARAKLCVLARIGLHVALRPADVPCRSIRPLSRTSTSSTPSVSATPSARSRASSTTTTAATVAIGRRRGRAGAGRERLGAVARPRAPRTSCSRSASSARKPGSSAAAPAAIRPPSRCSPTCSRSPGTRRRPAGSARSPTIGRPPSNRIARLPHYLRLVVRDQPGIIAALATRAGRVTTSTSTPCCRKSGWPKDALPFVITLEAGAPRAGRPRHRRDRAARLPRRAPRQPADRRLTRWPASRIDRARELRLRVPGSTSNLGPGFDALGLALQVYLELDIDAVVDDGAARCTSSSRAARPTARTPSPRAIADEARAPARSRLPSLDLHVAQHHPGAGRPRQQRRGHRRRPASGAARWTTDGRRWRRLLDAATAPRRASRQRQRRRSSAGSPPAARGRRRRLRVRQPVAGARCAWSIATPRARPGDLEGPRRAAASGDPRRRRLQRAADVRC